MQLPKSEVLNTECFEQVFQNKNESYKLFWFKAIFVKVCEGKTTISFNELVDEMICDAWYEIAGYNLQLGLKDSLEEAVSLIKNDNPQLHFFDKKSVILHSISTSKNSYLIEKKKVLIKNVPYRFLAPFLPNLKGTHWNVSPKILIEIINRSYKPIYTFSEFNGLSTDIFINDQWNDYIVKNQEIINNWLAYNIRIYLQSRNSNQ